MHVVTHELISQQQLRMQLIYLFALPVLAKETELYTRVFFFTITCLVCTLVAGQVLQNVLLILFTKSYSFQGDDGHNLSPCTQYIGTNIGSLSTVINM